VLGLLGLMILLSPLPEIDTNQEDAPEGRGEQVKSPTSDLQSPEPIRIARRGGRETVRSYRRADRASGPSDHFMGVFAFPHLLLGVVCIFVYVGAEVMAGDVIGTYGKALGMSLDVTKNFTSYTLWSMVVGYIIGVAAIPRYIRQENALKLCAILGGLFTLLAFATRGYTSVLFIALLGLANSLMWPAIFPMAIDGLGRFTKTGSALLIMGIAGGAVLPQVYGRLSQTLSPQSSFLWSILPCYLYILYYSTWGYRAGRRRESGVLSLASATAGNQSRE